MRPVITLALFFALPLFVHATRTQHAICDGYDDFALGKCRSTSLTDDGVLVAAPAVANLADLNVEQSWSVLALPDGSILAGTAPGGQLFRVSADGTVKELAKFDESHVYALARGPDGEIYAGTSPDGKIYRVGSDGKTEVWFEPKEKYIWALLAAPDGTLYAGTGTRGKIYRITGKGRGEAWYESNETHIRALALDKNGALLAGSSSSGYLYRVTGRGDAVVLADTGHEEVNQIVVAPDGVIWFTATGAAQATTSSPDSGKKSEPAPAVDNSLLELRDLLVTDGQHGGGGSDESGTASLSSGAGASALYRLDATLYPQAIWQTKETILSLIWDEDESRALVGTGNKGYTYAVTPRGGAMRLCKIESDSVIAMAMSGADVILAAGNPGRLFRLGHDKSQPGIYESDVIDSAGFARWGSVVLGASDPGSVKILTRSGNTSLPDKTWYPWLETAEGRSQSAPARYLQVQLQISAGTVDRIDTAYLPKNLPPHVDTINILPVGVGYTPIQSPIPIAPPRSADQLLSAPDRPGEEEKPQTRWQTVTGHGLRTVTWKASDPNNDELTYTVSWRKQGDTAWRELAKDIKETVLTWDTSGWADGRYELKVTASDAEDNAPGEGLTDEAVSRELLIDNAPPVIQIISRNSGSVEFMVTDELSGLTSVTVSTNGRDYKPLPPVDGILDSGPKRFAAKIEPGQTLFIRAEDGVGNVAGMQVGE
ncbi:MAG: WD40 repeat domain-containing protein [Methylacidiphilales bacterium]|nr:WD40 repeat domain-containing protein [Candidatus Methylacidiphilales bacterium]